MQKKYLTISTWVDKVTGTPKSNLAEINEGINKNGQRYAFAKTESTQTVDEFVEIGTIRTFNMIPVGTTAPSTKDKPA